MAKKDQFNDDPYAEEDAPSEGFFFRFILFSIFFISLGCFIWWLISNNTDFSRLTAELQGTPPPTLIITAVPTATPINYADIEADRAQLRFEEEQVQARLDAIQGQLELADQAERDRLDVEVLRLTNQRNELALRQEELDTEIDHLESLQALAQQKEDARLEDLRNEQKIEADRLAKEVAAEQEILQARLWFWFTLILIIAFGLFLLIGIVIWGLTLYSRFLFDPSYAPTVKIKPDLIETDPIEPTTPQIILPETPAPSQNGSGTDHAPPQHGAEIGPKPPEPPQNRAETGSEPAKPAENGADTAPEPAETVLTPPPEPAPEPADTGFDPDQIESLDPTQAPTSKERAYIRGLYIKYQSLTQVTKMAYGSKNKKTFDWVKAAVEEGATTLNDPAVLTETEEQAVTAEPQPEQIPV